MHGHVVNLTGRIYFLAHDWHYDKQSVFQCYDPEKNIWNPLEPFPHDRSVSGDIVGTAVLSDDDTILFNVDSRNIWAYDVIGNKWYPVEVEDRQCYGFIGEAIVLGDNTIYALTNRSFYRILVLSIEKKGSGCDLVFKCSLCSEHFVPGIELISEKSEEAWIRTRRLVYLGKDKFCLVQSCNFYGNEPVHIQLTYIKLERGNWMIVKECIHKVQGPGLTSRARFEFRLCFSLPKGATTVLKEEGEIFNLKPYPEEDNASNPVQEEEENPTPGRA